MRFRIWKSWDEEERAAAVRIAGLCVAALTLFIFISTFSYLFHWQEDMSLLGDPDAMDAGRKVGNAAGKLGFRTGHLLVIGAVFLILAVVFIIATRGYMGYGIPTSWKKTAWQTVLLFAAMGFGKALGGVFSDLFGARRVAFFSAAAALPFLLFGDDLIVVSLIGVMFFSMTMSVTLAVLVSVLKKTPGLAFGLTTIGLFVGSAPVFFIRFTSFAANCILIAVLTCICLLLTVTVMRKDTDANE